MLVALCCLAASPAGAATGPGSQGLVKSGHVFVGGSCPVASVVATVTIQTLEFAPGQPVTLHATVRNVSGSQCTVFGRGSKPTASMGPCNSISLKVLNSRGVDVWPGSVPYMCPLLLQLSFAAGAQFRAVGTWNQDSAQYSVFGGHPVPAGHYRVVVGGRLSFSITIGPS
jgi:hypothetical protein